MSNSSDKWSSDKDRTTKPSPEKPTHSKLTGKWKKPEEPKASIVNSSDNDQNPTKADGDKTEVDEETKRDAIEPPSKSNLEVATAHVDDLRKITPSMGKDGLKAPVEGEVLKNRLRIAERSNRK
jgi:hypothetical protein